MRIIFILSMLLCFTTISYAGIILYDSIWNNAVFVPSDAAASSNLAFLGNSLQFNGNILTFLGN